MTRQERLDKLLDDLSDAAWNSGVSYFICPNCGKVGGCEILNTYHLVDEDQNLRQCNSCNHIGWYENFYQRTTFEKFFLKMAEQERI